MVPFGEAPMEVEEDGVTLIEKNSAARMDAVGAMARETVATSMVPTAGATAE